MDELIKPSFWTMKRRAWLYGIVLAGLPLAIALGMPADLADRILVIAAAILGVTGSSMALANLTPDNVFKIGVSVDDDEA